MDFMDILAQISINNATYRPALSKVIIRGTDSKDFLNRMCTRDIKQLKNELLPACILNSKGRLIDQVWIFQSNFDEIEIYSSFNNDNRLFEWLNKFHFVEDISLENVPSCNNLAVMISGNSKAKFEYVLNANSSLMLTDEQWDTLRIANIIPAANKEICEDFMPQEIGLEHLLDHDKGCYPGQEVIRKALTYQKRPKKLKGLRLNQDEFLAAKEGQGKITSIAPIFVPNLINALVVD